ncbi:MAG: DUF5606 domain-containing protein [Bacteroidales bacterium]|nr:DUF5606 domain-containing protein [Bacteroidales bacterium]MDD4823284.1 DUF5606 domain-containing protein [Bacteroidales bacterium]
MLKKILSISGKPGLFRLVSRGKNMIIVESLLTGTRQPAYSNEKIVSLGDIAIFKEDGEEPLRNVLIAIKAKENGQPVALSSKASNDELKKFLGEVLPDFDRVRVYPSDIKKLISWYNMLLEKGVDFETEEETSGEEVALSETQVKEAPVAKPVQAKVKAAKPANVKVSTIRKTSKDK